MPHVLDGLGPHGRVEHRVVLLAQVRRADHRVVLGDELHDVGALLAGVSQPSEGPRHGLVHDPHGSATHQLLGLHQRQVGLDAGRVAVHQEGDRAGRSDDRRLRVPIPVALPERDGLVPRGLGRGEQPLGNELRVDPLGRPPVLAHDPEHRVAVGRVTG